MVNFFLSMAASFAATMVVGMVGLVGKRELERAFSRGTSDDVETSFALTFGYEDCPAASLEDPPEPIVENE
jgi:hypothetical protein